MSARIHNILELRADRLYKELKQTGRYINFHPVRLFELAMAQARKDTPFYADRDRRLKVIEQSKRLVELL